MRDVAGSGLFRDLPAEFPVQIDVLGVLEETGRGRVEGIENEGLLWGREEGGTNSGPDGGTVDVGVEPVEMAEGHEVRGD